ncbi:hypothetical protein J2R76_008275, partial [Bradyrhizobium sp. USDA 4532]|nr:hypothetical protein [Bradyrhizobium sp. USDA 4532]
SYASQAADWLLQKAMGWMRPRQRSSSQRLKMQ